MRSLPRFIDAFPHCNRLLAGWTSGLRSRRSGKPDCLVPLRCARARNLSIATLIIAILSAPVYAQQPAPENLTSGLDFASVGKTRVVLLKNDRCLSGIVRQLGDKVVVEIDDGATVSKPMSEVQTIADDMESIYQFKVSRYPRLGPGEHIRLARWTMANGMYDHASTHFLAVNREAGQNPLVRQLGIELREQLLQDEGFRNYLGLEPLKNAAVVSDEVRMASADTKPEPLAPILPAVLTTFADHVQPILLKRCSQSGCHGFSSNNRLKFVQPAGNSRARISEQNCRSALQFVEVDSSNMSVLLRYAVVAHGLQKEAAITAQEKRFAESIESWTTFARNR